MRIIVGAEELARCELVHCIKAERQIEETCEARQGERECLGEHQPDECDASFAEFENSGLERRSGSEAPGGERGEYHRQGDSFDGMNFEIKKGQAHYGRIGNRMENLGNEKLLPEFATDEVPVEECVLEQKPEGEDKFSPERRMALPDEEGKQHHQEHRGEREDVAELESVAAQASGGCLPAEKG